MQLRYAVKKAWPLIWYGVKWWFPQYTKPAEEIWKRTKSLRAAEKRNNKVQRRLADIDRVILSLDDQRADLFTERSALANIAVTGFEKEVEIRGRR